MKQKRFLILLLTVLALALTVSAFPAVAENAETPLLLGDLDADGTVTTTDARQALQASVDKLTFSSRQYFIADADTDGELTTTDARLSLQAAAGKAEAKPYQCLETANTPMRLVFTGYWNIKMPLSETCITTPKQWQAFLDLIPGWKTANYADEISYDEDFFATHALILLPICSDEVPEGMRLKELLVNESYVQPEITGSGIGLRERASVFAVEVPKEKLPAKVRIPEDFPTEPAAEPVLCDYSVSADGKSVYIDKMATWGTIYRVEQIGSKAALSGALSTLCTETGQETLNAVLLEHATAFDETFFEENVLILIPYSADGCAYRYKGVKEGEDGNLILLLDQIQFNPGTANTPSPSTRLMTLNLPKTLLDGKTVTGAEKTVVVDKSGPLYE